MYIPSGVLETWKDIATELNKSTELGVVCKLVYNTSIEANANVIADPIGNKQSFMPSFGGRSNITSSPGQEYSNHPGSASGIKQMEYTKLIDAKVYGSNKEFKQINPMSIISNNVWKTICKVEYIPDIIRCNHAFLDVNNSQRKIKVKMLMPPVSYGLGDKSQAKTFWEEISG